MTLLVLQGNFTALTANVTLVPNTFHLFELRLDVDRLEALIQFDRRRVIRGPIGAAPSENSIQIDSQATSAAIDVFTDNWFMEVL